MMFLLKFILYTQGPIIWIIEFKFVFFKTRRFDHVDVTSMDLDLWNIISGSLNKDLKNFSNGH